MRYTYANVWTKKTVGAPIVSFGSGTHHECVGQKKTQNEPSYYLSRCDDKQIKTKKRYVHSNVSKQTEAKHHLLGQRNEPDYLYSFYLGVLYVQRECLLELLDN